MSKNLMSTAPGGESDQYSTIDTVNQPPAKSTGQLGSSSSSSTTDAINTKDQVSAERGEKTAANIRYGQAVSESGMGGMTTTSDGSAEQGGYGGTEAREVVGGEKEEEKGNRVKQGMSGEGESSDVVGG
ncbi:hypothetical protein CAC42_4977 [Sphaceloma murrayae]|uniref:Uncharacterized protein n=1 Tax=Sphaceloma murrayae TaxID=2082308 RepID=A0A2K1QQ69_9PEZI|nr:hypothetical protein CAC42_4977 [Sphaceloma murrayae]